MKIFLTGAAGFIGSHILSRCLRDGHDVIAIDNFLTGKMSNIDAALAENPGHTREFVLHREDIRNADAMRKLSVGCDVIIHEAAIGSVPWSIRDPMLCHETNTTGFLNILEAARSNKIRRIVYASSSAVYGDAVDIPACEGREGAALSIYASTKHAQELYAESFARCYDLEILGLRYFNVFGARQDPNGPYAAVIPRWIDCMHVGTPCTIFGDGRATRDYCHVSNIVEANMIAAIAFQNPSKCPISLAMNIGCGVETSLLELHQMLSDAFLRNGLAVPPPIFAETRPGDIERSVADISKAQRILGYSPKTSISEGLRQMIG